MTNRGRTNSSAPGKRWWGVTLLLPMEWGEGVSNFLLEQGATGIEHLDADSNQERLRAYFLQDGGEKQVLRRLHRYLKSLERLLPTPPRPHARLEHFSVPEQDWGENWKRFFRPLEVTPRFVVTPPWSRARLKKGQRVIEIHPAMAFGTGTHATTRMSLRALEKSLRRKGLSVLDVGTGSGILAIAAARLGAKEVTGVDLDEVALENARENVALNDVSDVVRIRKSGIGTLKKRFDVVVANIDLKVLRRMRMPLLRRLKGRGTLILSGILEKEREGLLRHYMEPGILRQSKGLREEGWICLTFKKKSKGGPGRRG